MSRGVARAGSRAALACCASLSVVALLAGCAAQQPNDRKPGTDGFGFLAFGDGGYHYDYLDPDDVQKDAEAYIAHERAEWLEDRRAPDEFAAAPPHALPDGRVVAASGALPVAAAMRNYCSDHDCRFATMLGDNIYPEGATAGADGRSDADRFRAVFAAPYGRFGELAPGFRIYAALGNHDWKTSRAGALAELHYLERTPPFYMDGFFYRVTPAGLQGQVELFVLDTELLLAQVSVPETAVDWDGSEILLPESDGPAAGARQQLQAESGEDRVAWLERALATSTARWKIVIGHQRKIARRTGNIAPGNGAVVSCLLGDGDAARRHREISGRGDLDIIEDRRRVGRVPEGGHLRQFPAAILLPDGEDRMPVGQHPGTVPRIVGEDAVRSLGIGRNGGGEGEGELHSRAGRHGPWQRHAKGGIVQCQFPADGFAIDGEIGNRQTTVSIVEGIGEEPEPDFAERFRRRVAPIDGHLAADRARRGIERDHHRHAAQAVHGISRRVHRRRDNIRERIGRFRE